MGEYCFAYAGGTGPGGFCAQSERNDDKGLRRLD